MKSRIAVGAAIVFALALALPTPAGAHPGPRDDNGCHICRTKCEEYGLHQGMRHCHDDKPEQAVAPEPKGATISKQAYVDKIVDGDTVDVRAGDEKITVRLLGIDCPESSRNKKCERDVDGCDWQVPWGKKATERAAELLKHQVVQIECEGECKGEPYGRQLRYIRLADGRDFGLILIQEGLCADFGWKYPHPRGEEYLKAQEGPKKAKKGMWVEDRWDR